jgi:hypothetical protein
MKTSIPSLLLILLCTAFSVNAADPAKPASPTPPVPVVDMGETEGNKTVATSPVFTIPVEIDNAIPAEFGGVLKGLCGGYVIASIENSQRLRLVGVKELRGTELLTKPPVEITSKFVVHKKYTAKVLLPGPPASTTIRIAVLDDGIVIGAYDEDFATGATTYIKTDATVSTSDAAQSQRRSISIPRDASGKPLYARPQPPTVVAEKK